MHSNIGLNDGLLFRRNTNLCMGGGWSKSIKFLNNRLYIDSDVKIISTDCFGFDFIGPGEAIIFEDFINLQKESITAPQFRHIVFKKDAFIDEKAFFSRECNSNLYKRYTLYSYKGSNVEKFANEHGFKFKTLDKFSIKKKKSFCHYCTSYAHWIYLTYNDCYLYFADDYEYLIKKSKQENGDYLYYQIPYKKNQFVKPIKEFLEPYVTILKEDNNAFFIEDKYLRLEGEMALKYTNLLKNCFGNNILIKKWEHLCFNVCSKERTNAVS